MRKLVKNKMKKVREKLSKRKKGSIIIEFLVVLPVFMMLVWGILQVMLYLMASSTIHEATLETARLVSMENRGNDGKIDVFNEDGTTYDPVKLESLKSKIYNKAFSVVEFNGFILLFNDKHGVSYDHEDFLNNHIAIEPSDHCDSVMTENEAICVYTVTGMVGDRPHEQIVVEMKSPFLVIGSFIPGLDKFPLQSKGVSQKELSDRYQYYRDPSRTYGEETP